MGNRKAREFMQQQAEKAEVEAMRNQPRPANCDVHARGIGGRRLQLIVRPAFDKARSWDVRQGPEEWRLYRSDEFETSLEARLVNLHLVGYEPVSFDSVSLASFFRRVTALTLPISPDLSGYGGADGSVYQLAAFGDLHSGWRFQWWSEWPPAWQPLVDVANEMIDAFSAADGSGPLERY
jgi:hypothetical protein